MRKSFFALLATTSIALLAAPAPSLVPDNPPVHGDYIRSNGAHMQIKTKDKKGDISGTLRFEGVTGQVIEVAIVETVVVGNSAFIHGIVIYDSFGVTTGRNSYHRVTDNPGNEPDAASPFINPTSAVADWVTYLSGFATSPVDGHTHVGN